MNNDVITTESITERILGFVPLGSLHYTITFIGCGALGSRAALALVQKGARFLRLIDGDHVTAPNLSLQYFGKHDIGKPKPVALAERLHRDFPDLKIETCCEDYQGGGLTDIVIVGPDNIEARRCVWREARESDHVVLLVDGRTGGEAGQIFTIRPAHPEDRDYYEKKLVGKFINRERCRNPFLPHFMTGFMSMQVVHWSCGLKYDCGLYINLANPNMISRTNPIVPCL